MTKNIVEELPTRKHPVAAQKPGAGKEKPQDPEKKVKQAVYDIRYRARREEVPLRTAYSQYMSCLLYTSPSPRDGHQSRMPSSA